MNINYKLMKQVCLSPIDSFRSLGDVQETRDGIYIYRENPKAKILGIAHLDSVLDLNHFYTIKEKHETTVINAQLDDRLGVFVLLDMLPQLGIEFDLLLTEGEEIGRSTASYFEPTKDYNWMFSFDRRLNDVVMYQYEDKSLSDDLESAKFKIGKGSFSDIVFLDSLGIRGFNMGVGYNGEHSAICYAQMSMMISQVRKFDTFYSMFNDKRYSFEQSKAEYKYSPYNLDDVCYLCGEISPNGDEWDGIWICDECFPMASECPSCHDIVKDTEILNDRCIACQD